MAMGIRSGAHLNTLIHMKHISHPEIITRSFTIINNIIFPTEFGVAQNTQKKLLCQLQLQLQFIFSRSFTYILVGICKTTIVLKIR